MQERKVGESLGQRMEQLIFHLTDTHMFFKQLEQVDQPHISSLSHFDDQADLR